MLRQFTAALLGALCVASVQAFPEVHQKRAVCNRDNCLRAVIASSARPFASSAKNDCSSFLRKTVTPVVTTTRIVVSTSTENPTSTVRSNTATATSISTIIVTSTSTSTLTISSTSTATSLSSVQVTSAPVFTSTVVDVSTVTTQTTITPMKKRQDAIIPPRLAHPLDARAAPVSFITSSPTQVPAYASACSGTSRYSSACSCNGVSASTIFAPTSTVTVTSNSLRTVTPTNTISQTTTQTTTISTTQSTVQGAAESTTLVLTQTSTVFVTFTTEIPTTTTLVVPSTTTLVVATTLPPLVCNTFILQTSGGTAVDGQYVRSQGESQKQSFTSDRTAATVFNLDGSGRLVHGNLIANTDNTSLYYVYDETAATIASRGYLALTCSIRQNGVNTGALACSTSNGQNRFAVCPSIGPGDPGPGPALLFGTTSTSDCRYASLTAICLS